MHAQAIEPHKKESLYCRCFCAKNELRNGLKKTNSCPKTPNSRPVFKVNDSTSNSLEVAEKRKRATPAIE